MESSNLISSPVRGRGTETGAGRDSGLNAFWWRGPRGSADGADKPLWTPDQVRGPSIDMINSPSISPQRGGTPPHCKTNPFPPTIRVRGTAPQAWWRGTKEPRDSASLGWQAWLERLGSTYGSSPRTHRPSAARPVGRLAFSPLQPLRPAVSGAGENAVGGLWSQMRSVSFAGENAVVSPTRRTRSRTAFAIHPR